MSLIEKIITKTARMGVIGLGYVGLPLAVEKAKAGYPVLGFDVQKQKVDMVNRGENYIGDIVDEDLREVTNLGLLSATDDFKQISTCDCVAICVPTPLDKYYQPDISFVKASVAEVAKYAHQDMLIVLESTTYPGTTEEIIKPILEEKGFVIGQDIFLAFSPERVDPGNQLYYTKNTPKVVGGCTPACTEIAAALYERVLEAEVFKVSSPKVAEMEKILENTYRNINIALANEMAIVCNRMGIDVWEVIEAAKTKPYGFQPFYPGPGLGGHCIPIDPFYLTWKAREYDYHTKLIETAGEINTAMPEYCVMRISQILNNIGKALSGARVFLLGVAYKQDIDDIRESPALKVIEHLEANGAVVSYSDSYIPVFEHNNKKYQSIDITSETLSSADIVVITTAHTYYDKDLIIEYAPIIFDTKNVLKVKQDHVIRL